MNMEKIALAEHFHIPSMPNYSGARPYISDNTAAKYMDDRLAGFDDLRLLAVYEQLAARKVSACTPARAE
jgi:hypothetical protein